MFEKDDLLIFQIILGLPSDEEVQAALGEGNTLQLSAEWEQSRSRHFSII